MNLSRGQLEAIVEALTVILPARSPADADLRRFLREHKSLGPRDRALLAETVYAALRRRRLPEHLTPNATPPEIAPAALAQLSGEVATAHRNPPPPGRRYVATADLLGSFLLGTRVMSALVMIDSLSDNPAERP